MLVLEKCMMSAKDAIDDFGDTIKAYRESDGNRYIRIKTDNDLTYKLFSDE